MFPMFLASERLFLKVGQDDVAQDARVFSELAICPSDQMADSLIDCYFHWESFSILYQLHERKVCEITFVEGLQHLPDISSNPEASSCCWPVWTLCDHWITFPCRV